MAEEDTSTFHSIPEAFWRRVELVLPKYRPSPRGGRPRLPLRTVVTAILYVLRTGCQWKAMPREFGSGSAIHAYFQEWVENGVFEKLWRLALEEYDDLVGLDWEWQSLDGAMTKAPLGGEKNWPKPNRSWQIGSETFGADRRPGRAPWRGRGRRQCA
jgi:transposase